MGCPCSKLEDKGEEEDHCNYSEAVSQCKQRKELLRIASQAGSAFAKSHAEYLQALARTGCTLQDFLNSELRIGASGGEIDESADRSLPRSRFALEHTPMAPRRVILEDHFVDGVILRPPPPPPGCPSHYWDFDFFQQVEESLRASSCCKEIGGGDDEEDTVIEMEGGEAKIKEIHRNAAQSEDRPRDEDASVAVARAPSDVQDDQRLAIVPAELSLDEVEKLFRYVHQEFLRASQSGVSVGGILQSGRELGLALVFKNRGEGGDCNYGWSQALTLERLSAWELKLYEEVKALNSINADFKKKRKLLCKYDVNRVHDEAVDRTRADIKAIENQMLVAVQAMESTAAAVQKITNEELHFQLLELVQGLADMWGKIQECHDHQRNAVLGLKLSRFGILAGSPGQKHFAQKLQLALFSWSLSLNTLLVKEKEYISSIMEWLKASISKINRLRSLSRRQTRVMHLAIPEIYYLCQEWEKCLITLCKENTGLELRKFAGAISQIEWYQTEETKAQKRVDGLAKELNKKLTGINNLEKKTQTGKDLSIILSEKRASVDFLKQQLDQEKKKLGEIGASRRSFTLSSIENGLPQVFGGVCESARALMEVHQELHTRGKNGIKHSVIK